MPASPRSPRSRSAPAWSRHTFLLEPGRWSARGTFYLAGVGETRVRGESVVRRGRGAWTLRSRMEDIRSACEIEPPGPGARSVLWRGRHSVLGELRGRYAFADDAILSTSASVAGGFHGAEVLRRVSPGRYEARGVLYRGGEMVSLWSLTLSRVRPASGK